MEYGSGDLVQTPDGEAKLVGIIGNTVYAQTEDGVKDYKLVDISKLVVESKGKESFTIEPSSRTPDLDGEAFDEEMTNVEVSSCDTSQQQIPDFTKEFLITADVKYLEDILEKEKNGSIKFSKARKAKLRSAIISRGGSV